jgi:hypothetical protein
MHDPRIGRFFARDPLTQKYPWYSPYQFSGNRVIDATELEGKEEKIVWYTKDSKKPVIIQMTDKSIKSNSDWTRQQVIFYETIMNLEKGGAKWISGKKSYNFSYSGNGNMVIKGRDDIWYGHMRGTLTVKETSSGYNLAFDPTPINQKINYKTDWAKYKKAIKTFNPIYPVADPAIEGSESYANTVSNYKTLIMAPLAIEAGLSATAANGDKILTAVTLAFDADEFAGCGEKGSYLEDKLSPEGKIIFNSIKTVIDWTSKNKALSELPGPTTSQTIKDVADAAKGTTDVLSDLQNVKESIKE